MSQNLLRIRTFCPIAALVVLFLSPDVAHGQSQIRAEEARIELIRQVPISTEVTGTLINVSPNEEGQYVKEGDLLIEVNDEAIKKMCIRDRR